MDRMVESRLFSHFTEWKWDDTGWPPFETIYISIQSHRVGLYITVDSSIDAFCNVILMVSSEYTCIKIRYERKQSLKFFFIFFLVFFFIFLVFFPVFLSWHLCEQEMDRMIESRLFSHFTEWKWDDTGWPPFETIYISIQSHRVGLYVTVDSSIDAFCNVILMVSSEYTCIKIRYERKQSLKFFLIFFLVFFFMFLVFFFVFFSWHLCEREMDRMVESRLFSHFREWKSRWYWMTSLWDYIHLNSVSLSRTLRHSRFQYWCFLQPDTDGIIRIHLH